MSDEPCPFAGGGARTADVAAPPVAREFETVASLLEGIARLTGTPLALVSTTGRVHAWGGRPETCSNCPGPAGNACRLFSEEAPGHPSRPCRSGLALVKVPIPGHAGTLGSLAVLEPEPAREDSCRRFQPIAETLAEITRERTDLELMSAELAARYEELNLMYGVSQQLAHGGVLDDVLHYILDESMSITSGEWALLFLQKRNIMDVSGWAGDGEAPTARQRLSLTRLAINILHELQANDLQPLTSPREPELELEEILGTPATLAAVPIMNEGELEGCLAVGHLALQTGFTTGDARLLQALAQQVSLALANWELHASLREFLLSTVRTLVSAIDAKDSYTRGHSERVHRVAVAVGEHLGLAGREMEALRWASLLHDIGKLGVPEGILHKPGALTDEEFGIMREHAVRSSEIVSHIAQLTPALEGIRHHHERWDGSGYPDGLRAREIPLAARIIAVVDVFDALTSDRAYREALSPDEVRRYLRGAAGQQLDPEVVEAFDAIFPELLQLIQRGEDHGNHAFTGGRHDAPRPVAGPA